MEALEQCSPWVTHAEKEECRAWATIALSRPDPPQQAGATVSHPKPQVRVWTKPNGIDGCVPPLAAPAEPTIGPRLSPFMLEAIKLCATCGACPNAGPKPFDTCSCCRLIRYCSPACQLRGFSRGHSVSCSAPFPGQAELMGSKSEVAFFMPVLREFGCAHAHLAATCVQCLAKIASEHGSQRRPRWR